MFPSATRWNPPRKAEASMKQWLAIALALTIGCGADYTEVADDEPSEDFDDQSEMLPEWIPTGPPLPIDHEPGDAPPLPEGFVPPYDVPPVDKGAYTVLQGWGINGHLQFQDGTQESRRLSTHQVCNPADWWIPDCVTYADFCKMTAGGVCDNEWHIQADDLSVDSTADWTAMGHWVCGTVPWYPCIYPKLTRAAGGHSLTYSVNLGNCPEQSGARWWAVAEGIDEALGKRAQNGGGPSPGNTWSDSGITWTNVGINGDAHVKFVCEPIDGFQAYFTPVGQLAALGAPSQTANITESCEDWDGESGAPPMPYFAQADLMYTYSKSRVSINWNGLWDTIGAATTVQARRHVRNIMMHELGHVLGFHHSPWYHNTGYDVMRPRIGAEHDDFKVVNMSLHPSLREATWNLDMRTNGLQIYDAELSCFAPQ